MGWSNLRYDFGGASVVVTGGTSGIGAAIAAAFAEAGASVTITGTRTSASDYDSDLSAYRYLQLDIEDNASIDAVAEAIPKCDIVVNNAGLAFYPLGLDEHDPDVFARAIQVHLLSAYRLAHRLSPKLQSSALPGGASIIGIGSVTSFMGLSVTLGYGAGKTGLLGMTRGLAVSLGDKGVRVNVVAAGVVETRMTGDMLAAREARDSIVARTPLRRVGECADVAGATLFLASDAASWITGQVITVDGGYTIHA